jgi:hypothetical protein
MRRNLIFSIGWLLCMLSQQASGAAQTKSDAAPEPEALLRAADRARGGLDEGVRWTIVLTVDDAGESQSRSYLVRARGSDALVEALAPPRNKGEIYLFNDRNLWFIKPGLQKPISLSVRQRLTGDAANGDIANTSYARDYLGTLAGEESVQGEPCYRLNLQARSKNVTYDKIHYWISKSRLLGVKAEFRTVSDQVLKVATFEYTNKIRTPAGEHEFVSSMVLHDPSKPRSSTRIAFGDPHLEQLGDSIFNINNVAR